MYASSMYTCIAVIVLNIFIVNGHPLNGYKSGGGGNNMSITDDHKSYTLYTREDWGAVPPTDVQPISTPVPYVIIHHTYIPGACNTTAQCKATMKSMQDYHISLDWGDIGYHFCVGSEGGVYEGRGWHTVGIHAGPANRVSIGICLIGDWRVEEPPHKMLHATKALIADGVRNGVLSSNYKIKGHSQIMATECPGTALMNVISKWKHFSEGQGLTKP